MWRRFAVAALPAAMPAISHTIGVSNIQQQFDTFASVTRSTGEKHMTIEDFLRSKMPTGSTVRHLSKSSADEFAKLTDIDGDGGLDLTDYAVIEALVRIPRRDVLIAFRMFDLNEGGSLCHHELDAMIRVIASNTLGQRTMESIAGTNDLQTVSLAHKITGSQKDGTVTLNQFLDWVMSLRRCMLYALFEQYDLDSDGPVSYTHLTLPTKRIV
eukprot:TRINITY_DN13349_c0_g1_i3.p1 TRINITY_DN13349_c0_g1~~TRINITY_DN13349_c0_g1_i3.p1  ORF type:complete len:213 (+),score=44.35 TRINITY_DN13349_c0_g1_i3:136-774(+)